MDCEVRSESFDAPSVVVAAAMAGRAEPTTDTLAVALAFSDEAIGIPAGDLLATDALACGAGITGAGTVSVNGCE
jgi:hypothetical protein